MSYNFENLSPLDFEKLSIDLLQKHFSVPRIEAFAPGKDWGIDGRFIDDSGKQNIIQCKHYKKLSDLKSNLIKEVKKIQEKNKIKKPFNYILVTSLKLTPQNKEEIKRIIPFLNREKNIFGRDDLNNFIRKYPETEKIHFKLWLNSSSVLEKILNNDIFTRSKLEKKSIEKKMRLYVETESLESVYKKLEQNNFCIISGAPGVGKTTLAEMLILRYLLKQYEVIVISRDMKEVLKTYSLNKRILFYYNDFLGTTFLKDALPKNEDSDLVKFINNIKEDKDKKFILTTREYILKQAIQTYEKIKNSDILSGKFIIELKEYTLQHKAEILFNHLHFSEIDRKHLKNLKETKKYRDIVRHKNFNPRLIEFMSKTKNFKSIAHNKNKYGDWCIKNLDTPTKIWEYAFRDISDNSKALCYLMSISKSTFSKRSIVEKDFDSFYKKYCGKYSLSLISNAFEESIKEIEDSFISLEKDMNGFEKIEFINPSVNDFMESLIKKDTALSKNLIEISPNISQIERMFSIIKSEKEDKLSGLLEDKEIQQSILRLTEKKTSEKIQENKQNIFSFLFKAVSNDFIKNNENFLETLLIHFTNRLKTPMCNQDISLLECLACFNIFEEKKNLYFGKRKDLLEKAKYAFCQNIDGKDLIYVKEFMDKFPSLIDEQTESQVTDEAVQMINKWCDGVLWNHPEEIRKFADSIYKIENAFGFDDEKSRELYERAEELETEEPEYEPDDDFLSHQNIKKEPDISNNELDEMFNKL